MIGPRPSPERLALLRAIVADLPEPRRTVFIFCAVDGLDYNEVRARTSLSIAEIEQAVADLLGDIMRALDQVESELPQTLQ